MIRLSELSRAEALQAMRRAGIGAPAIALWEQQHPNTTDASAAHFVQVAGPMLRYPIRFTLPWSALISENRRFCSDGRRLRMTAEYRAARKRVASIAREAMTVEGFTFAPIASPLALHARVWFPDKRTHDVINFSGAVANALKGVVFVDDVWVYDARWSRAGVDCDRPRADIEVSPVGANE